MSYIPQLLASLERRLDELTTEVGALEAARAALDGKGADGPSAAVTRTGARNSTRRRPSTRTRTARTASPAPAAAGDGNAGVATTTQDAAKLVARKPRRRAASAAPRARRAGVPFDTGALERLLADTTAGMSAGAVAEQAGAGYGRVLAVLRELDASGQVRRTGARRSTLWRLVSDEERIAQRAAELEAQRRARRTDRTRRPGTARAA
jgi:hypothetical protein